MQCKCGGEATTSDSVNKKLQAVYTYYLCKACGIASPASLSINAQVVAHGNAAQTHYVNLDKSLASTLTAEAESANKALTSTARPAGDAPTTQYETGSLF